MYLEQRGEGIAQDNAVGQRGEEAERGDGAGDEPGGLGTHNLLPRLLEALRVVLLADLANHAETVRRHHSEQRAQYRRGDQRAWLVGKKSHSRG